MFKRPISWIVIVTFVFSLVGPYKSAHADVLNLPTPGTMVNLSPAYEPALIKGITVHKDNPFLFDFIIDTGNDSSLTSPNDSSSTSPNDSSSTSPNNSNMSSPNNSNLSSPNASIGDLQQERLKQVGNRLIKYFFACLTIPEKDLWVNLSPYEKDRMVPQALGQTALGRDLLAQDYILKQLTASLIYPEKNLGKEFWNRVYARAQQEYGTTQIPVNTFNKVWIIADKASVYEHGQTAFVIGGHLKVMLDEDYLALQKHQTPTRGYVAEGNVSPSKWPIPQALNTKASQGNYGSTYQETHSIASQIVRQIILPEIEKEVNTGKNFAMLRQIFYAQMLATWYKKNLKEALLNQVYTDKSTVNGIQRQNNVIARSSNVIPGSSNVIPAKAGIQDMGPEQIYQQYLKAYKKGVFNYIKEETVSSSVSNMSSPNATNMSSPNATNMSSPNATNMSSPNASVGDPGHALTIPRKYFSGGTDIKTDAIETFQTGTDAAQRAAQELGPGLFKISTVVGLDGNAPTMASSPDAAMHVKPVKFLEDIQIIRKFLQNWNSQPFVSMPSVAEELHRQLNVSFQSPSIMSITILEKNVLKQSGDDITINNDAKHGIYIDIENPDRLMVITPNGTYAITKILPSQRIFGIANYGINKWAPDSVEIRNPNAAMVIDVRKVMEDTDSFKNRGYNSYSLVSNQPGGQQLGRLAVEQMEGDVCITWLPTGSSEAKRVSFSGDIQSFDNWQKAADLLNEVFANREQFLEAHPEASIEEIPEKRFLADTSNAAMTGQENDLDVGKIESATVEVKVADIAKAAAKIGIKKDIFYQVRALSLEDAKFIFTDGIRTKNTGPYAFSDPGRAYWSFSSSRNTMPSPEAQWAAQQRGNSWFPVKIIREPIAKLVDLPRNPETYKGLFSSLYLIAINGKERWRGGDAGIRELSNPIIFSQEIARVYRFNPSTKKFEELKPSAAMTAEKQQEIAREIFPNVPRRGFDLQRLREALVGMLDGRFDFRGANDNVGNFGYSNKNIAAAYFSVQAIKNLGLEMNIRQFVDVSGVYEYWLLNDMLDLKDLLRTMESLLGKKLKEEQSAILLRARRDFRHALNARIIRPIGNASISSMQLANAAMRALPKVVSIETVLSAFDNQVPKKVVIALGRERWAIEMSAQAEDDVRMTDKKEMYLHYIISLELAPNHNVHGVNSTFDVFVDNSGKKKFVINYNQSIVNCADDRQRETKTINQWFRQLGQWTKSSFKVDTNSIDRAAIAISPVQQTNGGIDLNSANMAMTVTKDANGGVQVNFDPALIAQIRRRGVFSAVPVIVDVTTMSQSQIRPLLGLSP